MIRYLSTLALALAAAAALIALPAKAEKVVVYREGQLVLPQDVADVLGNTRSIRLLDDAPKASASASASAPAPAPAKPIVVAAASKASTSARPSAPVHATPAPRVVRDDPSSEAPSALSLPVQFGFDSAEILPAARTQLDALAAGIKLLSPESIVTIEGHTDASGSAAYNLELSRVRARAVRDYLVQRHGIDAARLKTVGYGKDRPIEDSDPHAAINRRVQFRGS